MNTSKSFRWKSPKEFKPIVKILMYLKKKDMLIS
jgi:hypothetical protein